MSRGISDRLRAAPVGDRQRQRRADAELARLVGGRHHHAAGGGVGPGRDHDRPAAQLGPAQQLHGDEEGVHVHVGDDSAADPVELGAHGTI